MADQEKQGGKKKHSITELLESVAHILVWVCLIRGFLFESFVIPTGSMADTLLGAHFDFTCQVCGHQYNYGFRPKNYGLDDGVLPRRPVDITPSRLKAGKFPVPRCPMCGAAIDDRRQRWVNNGDKIVVMKCFYQWFEPQRWDVVVFKNPTDPTMNYIKRLIGRPEETVLISDGDIYINGMIQQKPELVQKELWIPIWRQNYQPDDQQRDARNLHWQQPFKELEAAGIWETATAGKPFRFQGGAQTAWVSFDEMHLRRLCQDFQAYNGPPTSREKHCASDLRWEGILTPEEEPFVFEVRLGKYERTYVGQFEQDGTCRLINEYNGKEVSETTQAWQAGRARQISMALLDHRLVLQVDGKDVVTFDGGYTDADTTDGWGYEEAYRLTTPSVALGGRGGAFTLEHMQLDRDIHYTDYNPMHQPGRATPARGALTLNKDEFFVLGDNSLHSHDSRFWEGVGIGNRDKTFPAGTVPRQYLIGKAMLVFWPAGFRPHEKIRYNWIPNAGDMRFIH